MLNFEHLKMYTRNVAYPHPAAHPFRFSKYATALVSEQSLTYRSAFRRQVLPGSQSAVCIGHMSILVRFCCALNGPYKSVFWLLLKLSGAAVYLSAAGGAAGAAAAAAGSMTSPHQETPPFIGLTYVGPVIMSFGCFALIFALVVFCEARDYAIGYYLRSKLYAASARGPRHCRLPFRHDVIDLIVATAKRRAEKEARRGTRPSVTATPPGSVTVEPASAVERGDTTVEVDSVKVHRQPTPLPVSLSVDRTNDWLLSNGINNKSAPSSRSYTETVQQNHLDPGQSHTNRSTEWLLSNGMLHTASTYLYQSNDASVQVSNPKPFTVDRVSRLLFGNEMLHTESSNDSASHRANAGLEDLKRPDLGQHQFSDSLLSNGTLRELLPERDGGISDQLDDSIWEEMSDDHAGWMEDWRQAEVAPLMVPEVPSDDDETAPEAAATETPLMADANQPQVTAASLCSSASSSSVLFDVRIFSEVDEVTTTTPESNGYVDRAVNDTVEKQPPLAETVLDSPGSSPFISPYLGEHSSPVEEQPSPTETVPDSPGSNPDLEEPSSPVAKSSDDADGDGRRPTRPCRLPLADRGTPLPTGVLVERAGGGWTRGRREPETVGRYHAGIHCPPPLPPPPTSPAIVTSPGRSPRRHT